MAKKTVLKEIGMESKIVERIKTLEEERDAFVIQANRQIAAYNGAIAELKKLIEPEKKEEAPQAAP